MATASVVGVLDRIEALGSFRAVPGLSIKLFLPDGDPHGLRLADVSNWNGRALTAPRTRLAELLSRAELAGAGVYCLTGGIDGERPEAYVGEAETLAVRLKTHRAREFWTQAHVFLRKDDSLNKAHVRYLEGRFIHDALRNPRWRLHNTQPGGSRLSEADIAEMDVFYGHVCQLLPLLGCDLLSLGTLQAAPEWLHCKIKGLSAQGARSARGFTLRAGSEVVATLRASAARHIPWLPKLQARLLADGTLVTEGDHLVLARDVELPSPSAAAALVRGGNANGQTEWRDAKGQTLGELEARD